MRNCKQYIATLLVVSVLLSFQGFAIAAIDTGENLSEIATSLNLSEVAVLDSAQRSLESKTFKILFVDCSSLNADDSMIQEMKIAIGRGVPVIAFGAYPDFIYNLAQTPIRENTNLSTVAQGVYFDGVTTYYLFVGGEFLSESAVKDAYEWSLGKLSVTPFLSPEMIMPMSTPEMIMPMSTPDPVWYSIAQFFYYNTWEPYGKLNLVREWFKLKYDQSSTYDWYSLVMTTQSVPGHVAWNNDWRTADIWNWIDADYYGDPNVLIKYGPYTTIGQQQITYTIGVAAGEQGASVTASMSRTYTVKDIEVHDQSDFSIQLAKWWHNVNERVDAGYYTCTIEPGVTIRTSPSYSYTECFYQAQYMQPNWFWGWLWPDIYTSPEIYITTEVDYSFAPDTPLTPAGPTSGVKYTSYTYSTCSADPDGDNVRYLWDWKDGTTTWSGWCTSGATSFMSHSWSTSGTYSITVRAEDIDGLSSSWSMVLAVTIINRAPNTPSTPSGPSSGYTYISYSYSTSTTDPDGDNVKYQFNWGDGQTTTTGWYASGATGSAYHYWTSSGTYYVSVQAQDTEGVWSGWSSSRAVTITTGGGGGGGCPFLFVYSGSGYACEGLLDIHNPEGIDIIANHALTAKPKPEKGAYLFQLIEHAKTWSHIDQVKLYAALADGKTVELPLIQALHSEYGNVLPQLLLSDDWKTETKGADHNGGICQSIDLKFVALPRSLKATAFIFVIEGNNPYYKTMY